MIALLGIALVFSMTMTSHAASRYGLVLRKATKIGKHVSNFVWNNKGTIATGVVLTTFAANPEPFIGGATKVVTATSEQVVKPISEEIAKSTSLSLPNLTPWILAIVAAYFLYWVLRRHGSATRIASVVILFAVVSLGCTELWAASIDVIPQTAAGIMPKWNWQLVWNIVLLVLMLVPVA